MDDVEATLADLERRLRDLQAELDAEGAEVRASRGGPAVRPPGGPGGATPIAPADPLDAFGEQLRRTTAALVAAYDEAVGQARGGEEGVVFDENVAVEARADLPGLCALSHALSAIPGVHAVDLRAYAGGHAALEVALDRPVALVAELRRSGGPPFAVVESRPGRLVLEVGAPGTSPESPPRPPSG